jgi:hypothetical protein
MQNKNNMTIFVFNAKLQNFLQIWKKELENENKVIMAKGQTHTFIINTVLPQI